MNYINTNQKETLRCVKWLLGITLFLFMTTVANAQEIRANGYALYGFNNKISDYATPVDFYQGTIEGAVLWGGGFEFLFGESSLEIKYLRADTELPLLYPDGDDVGNTTFEMDINYILLSPKTTFFNHLDFLDAYAGVDFGAAIFGLDSPDLGASRTSRFAWGVNLGLNVWPSERIGLKFQTQLVSTVEELSLSAFIGTGGIGTGVSSSSTYHQIGLGGGVVFRLTE